MSNFQISDTAVEQRALELGRDEARRQLQAEAAKAQQERERLELQKQIEWGERITNTRAAVERLAPKYGARAELARRAGALLRELSEMSLALANELDTASQDSIAFGVHYMGMSAEQAAQTLIGKTPQAIHAAVGFRPQGADDEWAALILKALIHGNLSVGDTPTEHGPRRAGRVSVGTISNTYEL